jgi:hypothetical protein
MSCKRILGGNMPRSWILYVLQRQRYRTKALINRFRKYTSDVWRLAEGLPSRLFPTTPQQQRRVLFS